MNNEEMTDLEFFETSTCGHTMGHVMDAVFRIRNPEDAARFYRGYVEYLKTKVDLDPGGSAEQIAKSNIGFCFGEGMPSKLIAMWIKVCGATHPVFGTTLPTPEEAFRLGQKMGEKMRKKARKKARTGSHGTR